MPLAEIHIVEGRYDQARIAKVSGAIQAALIIACRTKHEVRVMKGQSRGSIINISSTYGHEGAAEASVYVRSKHAVEGLAKSVALEVASRGSG